MFPALFRSLSSFFHGIGFFFAKLSFACNSTEYADILDLLNNKELMPSDTEIELKIREKVQNNLSGEFTGMDLVLNLMADSRSICIFSKLLNGHIRSGRISPDPIKISQLVVANSLGDHIGSIADTVMEMPFIIHSKFLVTYADE